MSQRVSLLFGVHAHQPVGNFPSVLIDAHLRCYKPFLQVLYRYPDFRFAIHLSGWLLDYLLANYPEDMTLLQQMVARNQVELFGAGDTEPVLAVIPNRDRIGQIQTFSDKLAQKLGQRPQGAWLTERVWESTVIPALADCGIRYVTVDDYHFVCAGKTLTELNGYFTTEEGSQKLDLFPISEALRYKIPFAPAEETVAYLESLGNQTTTHAPSAAIYFDDIEKFGIWPETYHWVYEKGWLEQFIQKVLASNIITTQHFSEYHAAERTRGIVYLPTVSYIEMNEWTLPATAAHAYADLTQQAKLQGWYEQRKAFLRGGIWKNFFSRYPESNWMHKRMLSLSARFAKLPIKQQTLEMRQKLYEAQANDAYWHGMFGGLYLPHLRRAIYNAMLALEAMLDACKSRPKSYVEDTDLDGTQEAYLHNALLQAVVKLDSYASICELDAYALQHNFADTLRRQTEHYYRKIQDGHCDATHQSNEGIASAHDRISFKHEISAQDILADDHPRRLFVDFVGSHPVAYNSKSPVLKNLDFVSHNSPVTVRKHFTLKNNQLHVLYRFDDKAKQTFQTQINLAMPSCDGMGGRYRYRQEILGGFGQWIELSDLTEIMLDDDTLGGHVVLKTSAPINLRAYPHFSVSQSESGFEKIMQAVTLELEWQTSIQELTVTLAIYARNHA
ncbi:alpha-amylase [Nitrosomonas sp. PY1]|uniref:alpha-amylase/4-alpha-glucanotransferase domain-containing protein n=1 Tax=Nitrosomonas sp. PY1 TaxID=1803906 RepID=UPI001FC8014A|nr:alpha-amylase/4-alpha-glucanotransferase domain-containing protein [Nitrosomonas sp. PY1]GKS68516.1 alpha-amylase [Nitrosomonas sp. PY1]